MSELKAVLGYFGSKRLLAPEIVSHFGPHSIFYDLFAGSCAILFAKPPCRQEVASEKNPDVVNLLENLSHPVCAEALHQMASTQLLSETAFRYAATRLECDRDQKGYAKIERAFDFLLTSWQGPSGLAGTTAKPRFAKRNTASGGSTAARWRSVAESIPTWHERLRNVEFRNADAFEILEDVPDREGVCVYADPTYHPDARRGGRYQFEMTLEQHEELAAKLSRFKKTRVVVSHGRCSETDRLFSGWRRIDLVCPRKLGNTSGGETPMESAGECLYLNQ